MAKTRKVNISAALKNPIAKPALLTLGAVGAQGFEQVAGKIPVINKISGNPVLMGVAKVALGSFGPELFGMGKNAAAIHVGDGMTAIGGLQLFRKAFPNIGVGLAGIDDVLGSLEDGEEYTMNGAYEDEVSGVRDQTLAGTYSDDDE